VSEIDHPPSPDEVRADMELAAQTIAATVLGVIAVVGGPVGVVASVGLSPITLAIASKTADKLAQRRVQHAAETVLDAAETAGLPLDEFTDLAVSDDIRHELLARTLIIAQDTALRDKRRALGRALAAGVMGDDAKIDEELPLIRAVADVDEMHIRLLSRLREQEHPVGKLGWDLMGIMDADPGIMVAAPTLLATLTLHGLVHEQVTTRAVPSATGRQTLYSIAALGKAFLNRLTADDTSGPESHESPNERMLFYHAARRRT
jgi:hypothetical protein